VGRRGTDLPLQKWLNTKRERVRKESGKGKTEKVRYKKNAGQGRLERKGVSPTPPEPLKVKRGQRKWGGG